MSETEQSFPSSSRPDDTEYGTSELESVARRRGHDVSEGRVREAGGMGLLCSSGTTRENGLGSRRLKYYPSDSARTLLKECLC